MKIKRLIGIFLLIFSLTACSAESGHDNSSSDLAGQSSSQGYRQISIEEAKHLMARESGYIILDVRRPDEFAEGQDRKSVV